jgi:hypothetical protein
LIISLLKGFPPLFMNDYKKGHMKIIKIKPENKPGAIKGVDQYRVIYPDEPGKEKSKDGLQLRD